jgi:hypothetical protein
MRRAGGLFFGMSGEFSVPLFQPLAYPFPGRA